MLRCWREERRSSRSHAERKNSKRGTFCCVGWVGLNSEMLAKSVFNSKLIGRRLSSPLLSMLTDGNSSGFNYSCSQIERKWSAFRGFQSERINMQWAAITAKYWKTHQKNKTSRKVAKQQWCLWSTKGMYWGSHVWQIWQKDSRTKVQLQHMHAWKLTTSRE